MGVDGLEHGDDPYIVLTQRLVDRLERLSADSYWSHQASGVRGALLRSLERVSRPPKNQDGIIQLKSLVKYGYTILEKAARASERRI
ncbi:MAG: hypothetical protein ACWGO1_07400 [Anaerolineales bacterium]